MKNSSSQFNQTASIQVQRLTSVIQSKVDTSKVANPVSKKDWKSGTDALKEIFSAKDDEIEYWKRICDQQDIQISQLEIISEQKNSYESECYQLKQALAQKEYDFDSLKRNYNDSNRIKDQKVSELEDKCANLAVENERIRQMIEEWKGRFQKQERIIEELRRYQEMCKEYENKIGQFTLELERLNQVIRTMHQENDNNRNRISELELQVSQIRSYEARIKEYENRVVILTQEIQRLNEVINVKNNESAGLRIKEFQNQLNNWNFQVDNYKTLYLKIKT
ncbi:hypothetical protein IMG5_118120 [Ichthyophthirius multifiliis]|uniref:Uncharacterized protein n=1 Tax=Ichthyophthirius multifiliis TaxID=5932 RepID=G0QUP1_ICHMU|nr:hypothetical protein IMG5_118120 [Ichthyophthirius multifiliis]EGR31087.1 hypothetical protein IMG5_118120 [Ichthyophthirius multifiliis]|eukprot:XP_004034573.1 hypothetical protein IMG5_118120 [Ichthyophthirius multifiliis]